MTEPTDEGLSEDDVSEVDSFLREVAPVDGPFLPNAVTDQAGPFRLDARVGEGGMGVVYAAPSRMTFACVGSALAKCVGLGYKPWETVTECGDGGCHELSLRSFHQACARMIRADYCGDGTPHTTNGRLLNVWDTINRQWPEYGNYMTFNEAE